MVFHVLMVAIAFFVIWVAADIAIQAVENVSAYLKLSRFTISLFVLGAVTSFPEITVTANALLLGAPQVALGSLIGGQVFLLFFLIPFLALISRGLQLKRQLPNLALFITLLVALIPMLSLLDQTFNFTETIVTLGIYVVFVVTFSRQANIWEHLAQKLAQPRKVSLSVELVKLGVAGAILVLAGNTAVREMIQISALLEVPRFVVSFLLLPIGTNLPELTLAVRSVLSGRRELSLGNSMGSMTFNSLLLVLLSLGSSGSIVLGQNIFWLIILFAGGLGVFWLFCRSGKTLSVNEALLLLLFYFGLVSLAWWQGFQTILT